jgi:kumamolisin
VIFVPGDLDGIVEAVLGLDNRPQVRPHFRARITKRGFPAGFTPTTLASLYDFPAGTGKGVCIAVIELGGGYRIADLQRYFSDINSPLPKLSSVSVDHARNHATGDPNGPDGEVMLDIGSRGALRQAEIVVYFAQHVPAFSTRSHRIRRQAEALGHLDQLGRARGVVDEPCRRSTRASGGGADGITVCVASGDNGSAAASARRPACRLPGLEPACARMRRSLQAVNGDVRSETVWNDGAAGGASGGGVSGFFPRGKAASSHQRNQEVRLGRGVLEVSGAADPQTGYFVRVEGINSVIGGTSAVAPLWAGLVARINAAKAAPVGFINPHLYGGSGLNDVTYGDNGGYAASVGWDACSGLGTPDGRKIAGILGVKGITG